MLQNFYDNRKNRLGKKEYLFLIIGAFLIPYVSCSVKRKRVGETGTDDIVKAISEEIKESIIKDRVTDLEYIGEDEICCLNTKCSYKAKALIFKTREESGRFYYLKFIHRNEHFQFSLDENLTVNAMFEMINDDASAVFSTFGFETKNYYCLISKCDNRYEDLTEVFKKLYTDKKCKTFFVSSWKAIKKLYEKNFDGYLNDLFEIYTNESYEVKLNFLRNTSFKCTECGHNRDEKDFTSISKKDYKKDFHVFFYYYMHYLSKFILSTKLQGDFFGILNELVKKPQANVDDFTADVETYLTLSNKSPQRYKPTNLSF